MTINDLITKLLVSNPELGNQAIADIVREQFPEAKTSAKSVASVASVARRYGVSIPKREASHPSERIAELEARIVELEAQLEEALKQIAA